MKINASFLSFCENDDILNFPDIIFSIFQKCRVVSLIYVYKEILIKIWEDKKLGGKEVNKVALVDFSEHLGSASSFGIPCGLLTCHLNVNKAIKVNGSIESQKWF